MSNSSPCRVKRGAPPAKPLKRTTYRRALPELRRDFEDRCAYCMRHIAHMGETAMAIDHFDPRRKQDSRQAYKNLFLADGVCNTAKSDTWPSNSEQHKGMRFLNCCEEWDYGDHMVEDPDTHLLIGITPAGRYQIAQIDLNAPHLVKERTDRARIREILQSPVVMKTPDIFPFACIGELERIVSEMIPPIPTLPKTAAPLGTPPSSSAPVTK